MKVLQIIDRLNIGGAERVFLDLTTLLLNNGVQVDVMLVTEKGPMLDSLDKRCNVYFLNRKKKYDIKKVIECASICSRYDLVHVHMRFTYSYIKFVQLLSFRKFKIVFHDHYGDIDIDTSVPTLYNSVFKPPFYIGVSTKLVQWAKEKLMLPEGKVLLLRNTTTESAESKNNRVGIEKLLMISNIRRTKNIDLAIRLAAEIGKPITIFGNYDDGEYSERIRNITQKNPHVTIVSGQYNLKSRLSDFDIALHTSISESGPIVLVEYLSAGLPFLAFKTGEVAEVIYNDLPECFLETLEQKEWVLRLNSDRFRNVTADRLMSVYKKYFSPESYVSSCLQFYQKVLSS